MIKLNDLVKISKKSGSYHKGKRGIVTKLLYEGGEICKIRVRILDGTRRLPCTTINLRFVEEFANTVTLVKGSRYEGQDDKINPPHGVVGVVTGLATNRWVYVRWPERVNLYPINDLELVKEEV